MPVPCLRYCLHCAAASTCKEYLLKLYFILSRMRNANLVELEVKDASVLLAAGVIGGNWVRNGDGRVTEWGEWKDQHVPGTMTSLVYCMLYIGDHTWWLLMLLRVLAIAIYHQRHLWLCVRGVHRIANNWDPTGFPWEWECDYVMGMGMKMWVWE